VRRWIRGRGLEDRYRDEARGGVVDGVEPNLGLELDWEEREQCEC
jgi:hypothetical protein